MICFIAVPGQYTLPPALAFQLLRGEVTAQVLYASLLIKKQATNCGYDFVDAAAAGDVYPPPPRKSYCCCGGGVYPPPTAAAGDVSLPAAKPLLLPVLESPA